MKFRFNVRFLVSALFELIVKWGSSIVGSRANKVLLILIRKEFNSIKTKKEVS